MLTLWWPVVTLANYRRFNSAILRNAQTLHPVSDFHLYLAKRLEAKGDTIANELHIEGKKGECESFGDDVTGLLTAPHRTLRVHGKRSDEGSVQGQGKRYADCGQLHEPQL